MHVPRQEGKAFTTWNLKVDGRMVTVPVRAVDNATKFWARLPEYDVDLRDTDLARLKQSVTAAISKVSPITWENVILVVVSGENKSFPRIDVERAQNGTDDSGGKFNRCGPGANVLKGHHTSGDSEHSWRRGFQVVLPDRKEYWDVVAMGEKQVEQLLYRFATLFGVAQSGRPYKDGCDFKADQKQVEAAWAKLVECGLEISVQLGKART